MLREIILTKELFWTMLEVIEKELLSPWAMSCICLKIQMFRNILVWTYTYGGTARKVHTKRQWQNGTRKTLMLFKSLSDREKSPFCLIVWINTLMKLLDIQMAIFLVKIQYFLLSTLVQT